MSSDSLQTTNITTGSNDDTPSEPGFTVVLRFNTGGKMLFKSVPVIGLTCTSCKKEQRVKLIRTDNDRWDDLFCHPCRRELQSSKHCWWSSPSFSLRYPTSAPIPHDLHVESTQRLLPIAFDFTQSPSWMALFSFRSPPASTPIPFLPSFAQYNSPRQNVLRGLLY